MTACTNHGGKARRVVTAALVGVLSVGTVPMAALAEGVSDGIQTLALSAGEDFSAGTLSRAKDGLNNRSLEIPADGIITVSEGHWVVPTEIKPQESDAVRIYTNADVADGHTANATIEYAGPGVSGGSKFAYYVTSSDFTTPGTYTATVTLNSDPTAKKVVTFIVEDAKDLSDATVFDNSNGKDVVSDTTFTYNAGQQKAGLAIDGKALEEGVDFGVSYTTPDGIPVPNGYPINAGTYVATFTGMSGSDYDGQTKTVTFNVGKLDLASASIVVPDQLSGFAGSISEADIKINGVALSVINASGRQIFANPSYNGGETGEGSVLFTVASGTTNVINTTTASFSVVTEYATDVHYNGTSVKGGTVSVNLSDGGVFRPERIEVFDGSSDELNSAYYTVTYLDANDNEVEAAALANPGVYTVRVDVDSAACHYQYGDEGDLTFEVNVISSVVEKSDIVFKFDGKVGTTFETTYDGTDQLEKLETIVHTKWGDDLVAGTDYTVQAFDADGNEVDEIVNANEAGKPYTVKIELQGNYSGLIDSDLQCTIDVQPMEVTSVYATGGIVTEYTPKGEPTVYYVSYTGEEIEPGFELGYYTDENGDCTVDTDGTWHALPADSYEVTGYAFSAKATGTKTGVEAMKDEGFYTVEFAFDNGNYDVMVDSTVNDLTVTDASLGFADVSADAWYAQGVFDAKQLGYVKGVNGSNLYAPESSISRADALIIISRMAGFDQSVNAEDYLAENGGFLTRYTDVDKGAYYAKAVAWGTKMGIVNGYGDGSTFGPNDPITREQFAAMLANYAKATGDYSTPSDDALAGIADADTVDAWATDAVAWAVENGVMGNGGYVYGRNEISRAEVACMAVNYQPDGASSDVIG